MKHQMFFKETSNDPLKKVTILFPVFLKNGVSNQWYLITLTTRDFNKGGTDIFAKKSHQNEH